MSSPNRGEVWLVDLGYVAKVRPCLVISIPALKQERALASLIPHTTTSRGSRFEVQVKARFLREGVFDGQNIIRPMRINIFLDAQTEVWHYTDEACQSRLEF